MSEPGSSDIALPRPTLGYAPSTFLERGAVVPFTTPQLAGARVRPGERESLEMIVGNPAGGRGVYIVPCKGVFGLCSPTVHDRQLIKAVQELSCITPPAIRQISLDIAETGLAGRAAAAAATAARAAESALHTTTNFELLITLMRQTFPDRATSDIDLATKAKRAVASVAPRLQLSAEEVAENLEALAGLYAPLGIGAGATQAKIPRAIDRIVQLRNELAAKLRGPPLMFSPDAELVVAVADLTISCTRSTVATATGMLSDMPELLRLWMTDRASVAAKLARPDWLLDGWDGIAMVWERGGTDSDTLFAELADLVPATPREVSNWVNRPVESAAGLLRHTRKVVLNEDWRSGASLDHVARSERLRATELQGAV